MRDKRKQGIVPAVEALQGARGAAPRSPESIWAVSGIGFAHPTVEGSGREVADFGATTPELIRMAEWLKERQVESVAMESTGVYWIAPHEVLEARAWRCCW